MGQQFGPKNCTWLVVVEGSSSLPLVMRRKTEAGAIERLECGEDLILIDGQRANGWEVTLFLKRLAAQIRRAGSAAKAVSD